MSDEKKTLYERVGGCGAIAAVANDLLPRLQADPQLGFWAHRGELLIDFLCASAGGSMYYRGRNMALCHRGMRISESDWNVFLGHAAAGEALRHGMRPLIERRTFFGTLAGTLLAAPLAVEAQHLAHGLALRSDPVA